MKLGDPLVVSESITYQNLAIQEDYDYNKRVYSERNVDYEVASGFVMDAKMAPAAPKPQVDYKPQVIKLTQNVSVLFEMK